MNRWWKWKMFFTIVKEVGGLWIYWKTHLFRCWVFFYSFSRHLTENSISSMQKGIIIRHFESVFYWIISWFIFGRFGISDMGLESGWRMKNHCICIHIPTRSCVIIPISQHVLCHFLATSALSINKTCKTVEMANNAMIVFIFTFEIISLNWSKLMNFFRCDNFNLLESVMNTDCSKRNLRQGVWKGNSNRPITHCFWLSELMFVVIWNSV